MPEMESRFTEEQESFSSVMPVAVAAILTVFLSYCPELVYFNCQVRLKSYQSDPEKLKCCV